MRASTPDSAFVVCTDKIIGRKTERLRWRIGADNPVDVVAEIELVAREGYWPNHWRADLASICQQLALAECRQFARHSLRQRSMGEPGETALRGAVDPWVASPPGLAAVSIRSACRAGVVAPGQTAARRILVPVGNLLVFNQLFLNVFSRAQTARVPSMTTRLPRHCRAAGGAPRAPAVAQGCRGVAATARSDAAAVPGSGDIGHTNSGCR